MANNPTLGLDAALAALAPDDTIRVFLGSSVEDFQDREEKCKRSDNRFRALIVDITVEAEELGGLKSYADAKGAAVKFLPINLANPDGRGLFALVSQLIAKGGELPKGYEWRPKSHWTAEPLMPGNESVVNLVRSTTYPGENKVAAAASAGLHTGQQATSDIITGSQDRVSAIAAIAKHKDAINTAVGVAKTNVPDATTPDILLARAAKAIVSALAMIQAGSEVDADRITAVLEAASTLSGVLPSEEETPSE